MGFRLTNATAAIQVAYPAPQRAQFEMPRPLSDGDVLSIEIAHVDTLDQIATGRGTAQTLWDWVSNVLTWSRAADLSKLGQEEMGFQLQLCMDLIARWKRTGRVGFDGPGLQLARHGVDGPGLQLARHGVDVMDALARQVTREVARQAALWSEEQLARMRADEDRKAA